MKKENVNVNIKQLVGCINVINVGNDLSPEAKKKITNKIFEAIQVATNAVDTTVLNQETVECNSNTAALPLVEK